MNKLEMVRSVFHLSKGIPKRRAINGLGQNCPVFVFGSGRNGSTLLNRILNGHTQLFLPTEQYFLGAAIFRWHFYNHFPWKFLARKLVSDLRPKSPGHTWDIAEPSLQALISIPENERTLHSILEKLFLLTSPKNEKVTWGDTTFTNTYYIPEIAWVYPHARFVFLLRDGRDVVASFKAGGKHTFGAYAKPDFAAAHWMACIRHYHWLAKRKPVHLIRYEELVSNPEREVKKLCSFLSIGFQQEMLDFYLHTPRSGYFSEDHHQSLFRPVFQSSIGNYRHALTPGELTDIAPLLEKGLKPFGYQ